MKGRLPLPTETKKLRGTYQANKENMSAVSYAPLHRLDPPADVAQNPLAKEIWERLVALFTAEKVLTAADSHALELLCLSWATYKNAYRQILAEGLTVEDVRTSRDGKSLLKTVKRHPSLTTLKEAQAEFRQMIAHFGMTPATRRKVYSMKGDMGDPLEELRKKIHRARN